MPKAVAAKVLTAEPSCLNDNVVPQPLPFENPKNDHSSSSLAIVILDHLFTAYEAPRIMRGLRKSLVAPQFGEKGSGHIAGPAWSA